MNPESPDSEPKAKLPWPAQLAAGWPLFLVAIGGLIGGACGGLAYGVSISIFKKKGVNTKTYLYSILIGIGGIILYIAVIFALAIAFPGLFRK